MKLNMYQVDAFTDGPFTGNPAAVVPLEAWLPDEVMQQIAEENNLSETAFFVKEGDKYHIRWMTPEVEVDLCGHATLASAHVIWEYLDHPSNMLHLTCRAGDISVIKSEQGYTLDFPTDQLTDRSELKEQVAQAIGVEVIEVLQGRNDLLAIISSEDELLNLRPNYMAVRALKARGLLVSARGKDQYHFVSRGFFPQSGIDEDPATGSAHTTLTPYWAVKLGQTHFKACQLSKRRGHFQCELDGDRTLISGNAHLFMEGEIYVG